MIVNLTILIIATLNVIFIILFWESFINWSFQFKYYLIVFFFLIQVIITIFLIKIYYEEPILKLELTIKKILVSKFKDEKISIKKSKNEHINYIIDFFSNILNSLKNIKDEFIHWKEIKSEVQLAKEIQWKSINKKLIEIPSLNVLAKTKPSWEIGWDAYDIIKSEENYYIYVWDATWHWVWSWFIMMMVNALVSALSKIYKKWNDVLTWTNEILKPRVKANLLMTLLLLRWNEKEKKIYMTWAWHEYLIIYKQKQKKCFKVKSGWVALGMIKDISSLLEEKQISFEPWDIIVLYSDWITEAINAPQKDGREIMFGEERLMETIEKSPNIKTKDYKSAISVFNNITITLSKFMWYKFTQFDDITLIVLQYKTKDYNKENDFSLEIPDDFITEWNW